MRIPRGNNTVKQNLSHNAICNEMYDEKVPAERATAKVILE